MSQNAVTYHAMEDAVRELDSADVSLETTRTVNRMREEILQQWRLSAVTFTIAEKGSPEFEDWLRACSPTTSGGTF